MSSFVENQELTRDPLFTAATGRDRLLDPGLLADVAVRDGEDRDAAGTAARAERLERALVGLVGAVARNRELLEPAVGELAGRHRSGDR